MTSTTDTSATLPEPVGVPPEPPRDVRPPAWAGALAGVIAAAAGLAVGELVAAFDRAWRSPVVSVGDRVVDGVPPSVKDLAIDWFGTNDKVALITGTVILLGIFAAVVGALAVRRDTSWGIAGVAVFGGVGILAASEDRIGSGLGSLLPAIAAALTAAAVLLVLLRALQPKAIPARAPGEAGPAPQAMTGNDRRRFLTIAGATAAVVALTGTSGRWLKQRLDVSRERASLAIRGADKQLPPVPADPAKRIDGLSPLYTPNDDFYRIDTALLVPQVTAEDWTLRIHGLVDEELTLTFDELLGREIVEADVTLSCVSNEVGGDLVGNARWAGVRLDDLLAEAGIRPEADQIVGRSVDGFTAGFPVSTLDGRDAIVAVRMNDAPLPVDHGYPARLVVPGLYGYVSATKWLSEIELTRFDEFEGYWVPRGWAAKAPVRTQSRIDVPRGEVAAGTTAVAGVAWAPTRGIERVEVQVDDGSWQTATLGPAPADTTWRQWWIEWDATPGDHQIRVRATDGEGDTQPEEPRPVAPDGATGWHTITVRVG